MATSASEAELLIVVDNLKEFVKKKMNLRTQQYGEQVFHICATMEILEYKIKQKRGKMENLVISSIRELVHEAEEAIDECVFQELMMKRKNQLQISTTSGFEKNEYNEEISTRLENVRKRFIDLLRSFEVLEPLRISKKNDQRWNLKALFSGDEDEDIVGRAEEVKKVINLLENDSNGKLEVISITGMVGLGKTTVARRVFKDQKVESLFTLRAFVTVPQDYSKNKNKVFVEIFRQFGKKKEISELEMEEETEKLVEFLGDFLNKSSNFFIVLDDVSSSEVLDDISSSMAAAQGKGKGNQQSNNCKWVILITAKRGAKSAVGKGYYSKNHRNLDLPLLNSDESRKLFRSESFGKNNNKCPRELEMCETKILEKCYGLPLAIVSFSRILSKHRRNRTEWWNRVADCVNVFTEETLISNAIRSIFEGLNDNLKLCFLYLGVFERGVEIPAWVLLRLWTAEGFVKKEEEEEDGGGGSSRRRKLVDEVAEDYLDELFENNLVMIHSRKSNGKIKEIKIHEGVLDFCISEAKQENLFNESFLSENCRRFCIRDLSVPLFHRFHQTRTTKESNPLRSIFYFSDDIQMNPLSITTANIKPKSKRGVINKVTNSLIRGRRPDGGESFALFLSSFVPKTFKLIRVIDVRSFELPKLPVQLFSLFLLRYMAISCNSSFLPEELSNLCNLETLIVHTSSESDTLEIGADIRNMSLLEHIHTNKSILLKGKKSTKNKNKNNPNLRTISRISNKCCTEEFFNKIPNVKKLGISWKLEAKIDYLEIKNNFRFFDHLSKLENLENLKLLNEETSSSSFNYFLPIKSHIYPNNLKILKLMNIYLEQENMFTFGTLLNLEILKLQGIQFAEPSWKTKDGGFLRLKVLHIRATNLETWEASGDHFPVLTTLFLWHCYDLQFLPVGLSDMKNLQNLNIRYGHDSLAPSLKTIFSEKEQTQPGFDLTIFPDYK